MNEENTRGRFSGCGCLIWFIIIFLCCKYCSREDENKTIVQTTIDYVHEQYEYADSVFNDEKIK